MRYKVQYECMDKECNTVIVGSENRLDGINCPRCNGPVTPKPFEQQKRVNYGHYQCLCCDHKDKVQVTKEEYKEVMVCPKCNGAFVDKWKIAKYQQDSAETKQRLEKFNNLMSLGLLTVNEIRELNGLAKIPGGEQLYRMLKE
jgi:uncharacterized CHY-type Zn-finger protein